MQVVTEYQKTIDSMYSDNWRQVVVDMLNQLPAHLLKKPSSTSGKYHPRDEVGENGMRRHIHRCIIIAEEICRMRGHGTYERDLLLTGCIIHDIFHQGKTCVEHAKCIYDFIGEYAKSCASQLVLATKGWDSSRNQLFNYRTIAIALDELSLMVRFHEGRWTVPVEKDKYHFYTCKGLIEDMHIVDFMASRRSLYDIMQSEDTWDPNRLEQFSADNRE